MRLMRSVEGWRGDLSKWRVIRTRRGQGTNVSKNATPHIRCSPRRGIGCEGQEGAVDTYFSRTTSPTFHPPEVDDLSVLAENDTALLSSTTS